MRKNQKIKTVNKRVVSDIITIVLFLAVIFGYAVAFVVKPDVEETDIERDLQTFPSFNMENVIHGGMATQMDQYFCDQFPLRKDFITLKANAEKYSYRAVNNGVLYAEVDRGEFGDVKFFVRTRFNAVGLGADTEFYSKQHVDSTLTSLKTEIDKVSVPVDVMLPPRAIDVIGPTIGYPTYVGDTLNAQAAEILGDNYVDVMDTLRGLMDENMQPYFSTDHHWTPVGSYYAFETWMNSWTDHNPQFESYDYVTRKIDFLGTSAKNGNYYDYYGEAMETIHFDRDHRFKIELGQSLDAMLEKVGLYDMDALDTADPYNVYLHGKAKYTRITAPTEERDTILVVKDSFAHVFVPHLVRYYDVVMVDIDLSTPNEVSTINLSSLVEKTGADRVLIMYNLQNVIETSKLAAIKG